MWRNIFTVFLAFTVLLFSDGPVLYAQYPTQGYPPQNASAQGYPNQSYPDPQAQPGYPQSGYPQSQQGYPQNQPYGAGQYPQQPQQYPQNDPSQDPNAAQDAQHGVARLSVVQGDVNVKRADNGELVAAVTNAPVMVQEHLQTSPGSRAEVQLDYGDIVRLGPNTDIGFADLEYRRYQIQLATGSIIYRVLHDSNAQAEIDTPSIALRPEGQGEYRVSVLDDGTTQISLRSGQAEIFSPRGSERLVPGRTILVRGNPADPEFQPTNAPPPDQLDDWSANRDRELLASQSYRYVSPDISGAEDLDANGSWVPSQYGQVWQPTTTPADWSPYSDGQWSYQPYYRWTWVDAAPWGWAPYHYGRWFWNGGHRWCWWPGAVGPRYLWSPALVGFFGVGVGVGIGLGALGWVALAPFELFHAWWGIGLGRGGFGGYGYGGFGRGVGLAGVYRNAAIRGGALTASYNGFGGFRQRFSPATAGQLSGASMFRGGLPVSPTRASYQFSARAATSNPRFASAENRQFFSHQSLPNRGGFARVGGGASNPQASYNRGNGYAASPNRTTPSTGGWQRFGDPGRSSGAGQGFVGGGERSGWHTFGEAHPQTPTYNNGNPGGSSSYAAPRYQAPQQRQSYSNGYGGGRSNYSAPQAQHYSAPRSAPQSQHYSAPSHGGGGGGGGSHGGGGEHSSSGGHRGR